MCNQGSGILLTWVDNMDRAMSEPWQNIAVDGVIYQRSFCPWEFEFVWKCTSAPVLFVVAPSSACAKLENPVFRGETDLSLLDAGWISDKGFGFVWVWRNAEKSLHESGFQPNVPLRKPRGCLLKLYFMGTLLPEHHFPLACNKIFCPSCLLIIYLWEYIHNTTWLI